MHIYFSHVFMLLYVSMKNVPALLCHVGKVHIACAEMYFTINISIIIAALYLLVAALCCI